MKPVYLLAAILLFAPCKPAASAQADVNPPAAAAVPAPPKTEDPGDLFVTAYMAFQKGEKLTQAHDIPEAIKAYTEANTILAAIGEKYPEWKKEIVAYRRNRVATALKAIQP